MIGELAEDISTELPVAFSGVLKTISAAVYVTNFADRVAQIHACCPGPSHHRNCMEEWTKVLKIDRRLS